MDKKEIFDRIEYVVTCVGAFAQRYNLSNMQPYAYSSNSSNPKSKPAK